METSSGSTFAFEDAVQPFQVEDARVRGRMVRLGPALESILGARGLPAAAEAMLAEAVTLAALLASGFKYKGVFTLQTQGDGPVGLMVADVTSEGGLRGYARVDSERMARVRAQASTAPVPRLLGAGNLSFTLDQGPATERYQGIVALEGGRLAECVQTYFRQSEQLETAIVVAENCSARGAPGNSPRRAAALMVQRLPPDNPQGEAPSPAAERAEDDWRRVVALASSVTAAELLDDRLQPTDVLARLFHEDGVRAYRLRKLRHACRCSQAKVERTLRSFPRAAIEDFVVDGMVDVTCEFCGAHYRFDESALARLFADGEA
ncbi:MAG: Hsp33 family molecular chaperone HslO [Rhodospirillales bacterium]|nr:Hsp33 family molecular chaperone HslO [Rhodospirillales bacterium]